MHRAGVTCTDCHEPHGLARRAEGNQLCAQCHEPATFDGPQHHHHEAGGAGAQCVNCHMPSRTYMQVHSRRDHSFRLPRPDLSEALGTLRSWGAKSPGQPHYAIALSQGRHGEAGGDAALAALVTDTGQAAIVRATALTLLGRTPGRPALEAVVSALTDAEPLVRLGAVSALEPYAPTIQRPLAALLLRDPVKVVRIAAARLLAAIPAASWPAEDARLLKQGIDEWVASELASAERPETHLNLGALWADQGKAAEAEAAFRTALALDPRFVPALLDLADLYRSLHRDGEAGTPLRQAVAAAPDDADALYALGLWLVRQARTGEALEPLARAAKLRPGDQRFAQAYRLVLSATGGKP